MLSLQTFHATTRSVFNVLQQRTRKLLVTASVIAFAACGQSEAPTGVQVAAVEVSAASSSVRAGTTLTMSLRVSDAAGKQVDNVAVYWSTSDATIATVSSAGVVNAIAAGEVTISASALGKSATTKITVTDREVATVRVTPSTASVRIGTTTPLTATTFDADQNPLQRTVTWATSDATIATVSAAGVVTGVATGAVTITATSESKSATAAVTVTLNPVATVTVSPPTSTIGVGAQATLAATLKDAAGATLSGRIVSWSSSNLQLATVSSTGVVTALAPGSVTISATSEGHNGSSAIVVLARLASTVTLSPSNVNVTVGNTQQLSAQITDASGNLLSGRPISYVSDNGAVAQVDAAGLVTAVAPGTATITATSEGKVGTATIVVTPLPVATVTVSPSTANIFVGGTTQLSAQAISSGGSVLSGRSVTWISGSPSVTTVSVTGLVTAIAPGTALVLAVIDGVSGSATITVRIPAVASVAITPSSPSATVGGSVLLTATTRDDTGKTLSGRTVTWTSSDESVGFVSSSGLVIGLKAGTTTISATSEGITGTTVVTIR